MITETIGWIGGILLALCALPLAIDSFRKRRTVALNLPFFWMWFIGEIFLLVYSIKLAAIPLLFNYSFNIACLVIVGYFFYFPKK